MHGCFLTHGMHIIQIFFLDMPIEMEKRKNTFSPMLPPLEGEPHSRRKYQEHTKEKKRN